jgi:pantetheine-phosphate adenylyltransferase
MKSLYPLSADPMHEGHIRNIEYAAQLFENVHVLIGTNNSKKYLFNIDERLALAQKSIDTYIKDSSRITIGTLDGLLSTYAQIHGYSCIIRGARNQRDFEYEKNIAEINSGYGLTTVIFPSDKDTDIISSTMIKELVQCGGFVNDYVAPAVKQSLEERLCKRTLIGVTGSMGAGKSTFCREILDYSKKHSDLSIYHLDVDFMVRSIYTGQEEIYSAARDSLKKEFGEDMFTKTGINRKKAAEALFRNPQNEKRWSEILKKAFMTKLETEVRDKQGIILIDAAYLVEKRMMHLVNNNIILVTCDETERFSRIMNRDNLSKEDIECKTGLQLSQEERRKKILEIQDNQKYGFFYEYQNDRNYGKVIRELNDRFPLLK